MKSAKITSPRYQQIATDIALKIIERHYKVGDKIYARSSIASQYGVSPETARRAIAILTDLEIVDTAKGSGVIIKSFEKAKEFIRNCKEIDTVNNLKNEILESVKRQTGEIEFLKNRITQLIERTDRFGSMNPFTPFEIEITSETPFLNKTISEVNFWHNTTATIIAIRRKETLLLSPGPYAVLETNDIIYFIGDENCSERVQKFLYK